MKSVFKKVSVFWIIVVSFFVSNSTKAATKGDITSRINKVRKELKGKVESGNTVELTKLDLHKDNLNEWVNWGNWGNWNNWNNWRNWNNWANWANWGNY